MLVGESVKGARDKIAGGDTSAVLIEVAAFPHKVDPAGRCEHLAEDNRCKIYATRPDVCSVDTTFKKYFAHMMSRKKHYEIVYGMCADLQKKAGVNP